jgi:hypothetical protein
MISDFLKSEIKSFSDLDIADILTWPLLNAGDSLKNLQPNFKCIHLAAKQASLGYERHSQSLLEYWAMLGPQFHKSRCRRDQMTYSIEYSFGGA